VGRGSERDTLLATFRRLSNFNISTTTFRLLHRVLPPPELAPAFRASCRPRSLRPTSRPLLELSAASRTSRHLQSLLTSIWSLRPSPELTTASASRACCRHYSTCSEPDPTPASCCHPTYLQDMERTQIRLALMDGTHRDGLEGGVRLIPEICMYSLTKVCGRGLSKHEFRRLEAYAGESTTSIVLHLWEVQSTKYKA